MPTDAPLSRRRRGGALAATVIASSMGFIDGTVVHIALPAIQRDFGARFAELQWVANSYLVVLCALIVVGGELGDRFGVRRVFITGIIGFTLSSVACALAPSAGGLIAARALQGAMAALMTPLSLAVIARLYPPGQRGRAIGIWSTFASASAAFGPVLGGVLIEHGGWALAFWINAPLGALAAGLAIAAVPARGQRTQVPVDWLGCALLIAALGALSTGTIAVASQPPVSLQVWPWWLGGALALAVFFAHQRRAPAPLLPPALWHNRPFVVLNAFCLCFFAAFAAVLFLLPYVLIRSLGLGAGAAAMNILPMGLAISVMARPAARLAERIGPRAVLSAGALGLAVAVLSLQAVVWLRTPWIGALCMAGVGLATGLMVGPLTTAVLNSVDTAQAGLASGINHAVTSAGNLAAVAGFGAVLVLRYTVHLRERLAESALEKSAIEALMATADTLVEAAQALPAAQRAAALATARGSLDAAFVDTLGWGAALALIAAWVAGRLPGADRAG